MLIYNTIYHSFKKISFFTRDITLLLSTAFVLVNCENKKLDQYGGYYDEKLGVYRYEKVGKETGIDSADGLRKPQPNIKQNYTGKIVGISGNLLWIQFEKRPVYTLLAQGLSWNFKNEKDGLIGFFLEGISLKAIPVTTYPELKNFYSKAEDVIKKVVIGKDLEFTFYLSGRTYAYQAIVFLEQADVQNLSQSLNYWIIKNGLSPYILPPKDEKPNADFIKAEDLARSNKAGIWAFSH